MYHSISIGNMIGLKTITFFFFVAAAASESCGCSGGYSNYREVAVLPTALNAPVASVDNYVSATVSAPSNIVVAPASVAVNSDAAVLSRPSVTRTNSGRRYRVALDNCGPKSRKLAPVAIAPVTTSPVVGPTVTLPYRVPKSRTVSNSCRCVKIVAKPQPIEQVIIVPVQRRYVQTLSRPVYEIINYGAEPINCPTVEQYAC